MALVKVNQDVLLEILKFLHVEDVLRLTETCKSLWRASLLRPVWMDQIHEFNRGRVPLVTSSKMEFSDLSLYELQRVVLKTSSLHRNWLSPSPLVKRHHTLSRNSPRSFKWPLLKFLGEDWLLSAFGTNIEVWNIKSRQLIQNIDLDYPIITLDATLGSQCILLLVKLSCPPASNTLETIEVFKSTIDGERGLFFQSLFQQHVSSIEFWEVGRPCCKGNVFAYPAVSRPSMQSPSSYFVMLVDFCTGRTVDLVMDGWCDVSIALSATRLFVSTKQSSDSQNMELQIYDLPSLFKPSGSQSIAPILKYSLDVGYGFKGRILPPTDKDTLIVCTESAPGEVPRLSRYAFSISEFDDGTSCRIVDVSMHELKPPEPVSRYGASSTFLLDRGYQRALVVQNIRIGPGVKTKARLYACSFLPEGETKETPIDFPELTSDDTISHTFSERFGSIAWVKRGNSDIHICQF